MIVIRSIAYIAVFTVIVLYGAARIFSSERIITSRFTSMNIRDILRRGRRDE